MRHMLSFDATSWRGPDRSCWQSDPALKYLAAAANAARKLADLEREGLIKLPHRTSREGIKPKKKLTSRKAGMAVASQVMRHPSAHCLAG